MHDLTWFLSAGKGVFNGWAIPSLKCKRHFAQHFRQTVLLFCLVLLWLCNNSSRPHNRDNFLSSTIGLPAVSSISNVVYFGMLLMEINLIWFKLTYATFIWLCVKFQLHVLNITKDMNFWRMVGHTGLKTSWNNNYLLTYHLSPFCIKFQSNMSKGNLKLWPREE